MLPLIRNQNIELFKIRIQKQNKLILDSKSVIRYPDLRFQLVSAGEIFSDLSGVTR